MVTDLFFDFGTVLVGFQSVVHPTFTVAVSLTATNGYNIINRTDVGGTYGRTWQPAHAGWESIVKNLTKPFRPSKTGY